MKAFPELLTSSGVRGSEFLDGRYELQQRLGRGGQGTVWKAIEHNRSTNAVMRLVSREPKQFQDRSVAIKILNDPSDPNQRLRFEQEIRALELIEFPSIVPIYRSAKTRWRGQVVHYFVMRFEEGQTIEDRIARAREPLLPSQCIRIGLEVLGALSHAHAKNIVHRDLKPSNIIQRTEGAIVLVDFGIATNLETPTRSTHIFATPHYAAPERFDPDYSLASRNPEAVAKLDVFSLAVILYEMLTLRPAAMIRNRPPALSEVNPAVTPALGEVIHKAMAKKPEHRLTVAEFVKGLEDASDHVARVACVDPGAAMSRLSTVEAWLSTRDGADLNNAAGKLEELQDEGWCFEGLRKAKRTLAERWLDEARRLGEADEELKLTRLKGVLGLSFKQPEAVRLCREMLTPKIQMFVGDGSISAAAMELRKLIRLDSDDDFCGSLVHAINAEIAASEGEIGKLQQSLSDIEQLIANKELIAAAATARNVAEILANNAEAPRELRGKAEQLSREIGERLAQAREFFVEAEMWLGASRYVEGEESIERGLAICPIYPELLRLKLGALEAYRVALSREFEALEAQVARESDLQRRVSMVTEHAGRLSALAPFRMLAERIEGHRDAVQSLSSLRETLIRLGDFEAARRCQVAIHHLSPGTLPDADSVFGGLCESESTEGRRWQKRIEYLTSSGRLQAAKRALSEAVRVLSPADLSWEFKARQQIEASERAPLSADTSDRAVVRALRLGEWSPYDEKTWLQEALATNPEHALARHLLRGVADTAEPVSECHAVTPASRTRQIVNNLVRLQSRLLRNSAGAHATALPEPPSAALPEPPSAAGGAKRAITAEPRAGTGDTVPGATIDPPLPAIEITPAGSSPEGPPGGPVLSPWFSRRYVALAAAVCLAILAIVVARRFWTAPVPAKPADAVEERSAGVVVPDPPKPAPATSSARIFTDLPPGATVRLNGNNVGRASGAEIAVILSPGDHTLQIDAGPAGKATLPFKVDAHGKVGVGELSSAILKVFLIQTADGSASVLTTVPASSLRIDSGPLQALNKEVKPLAGLTPGKHRIVFNHDDQVFERGVEIGAAPSLIVFATHDYASLEVLANVEGATVRVDEKLERPIENGKAYYHRLIPGDHVVTLSADEYLPVSPATVSLSKGKKFVHNVTLAAKPKFATLRLQGGLPDAQVTIDGRIAGAIRADGVFADERVEPGERIVEITKPGYSKIRLTRRVQAGDTVILPDREIRLERLPGKLEVRVSPPNAKISLRRLPDGPTREIEAMRTLELPEGRYVVSAELDGYDPGAPVNVVLTADQTSRHAIELLRKAAPVIVPGPMSNWEPADHWVKSAENYYTNVQPGLTIFKPKIEKGTISFHLLLTGKKVTWLAGYARNKDHYFVFELDRKKFSQRVVTKGKPGRAETKDHNLKENTWVEVRIALQQNEITHTISGLEFRAPPAMLAGAARDTTGQFAFQVHSNEPVSIVNFTFVP